MWAECVQTSSVKGRQNWKTVSGWGHFCCCQPSGPIPTVQKKVSSEIMLMASMVLGAQYICAWMSYSTGHW